MHAGLGLVQVRSKLTFDERCCREICACFDTEFLSSIFLFVPLRLIDGLRATIGNKSNRPYVDISAESCPQPPCLGMGTGIANPGF